MAGEDKSELIDFDTTYSDLGRTSGGISMKPLLPAPLPSFGLCDYGANPFDQLLDLTNKKLSCKDDPFEMVFEKATGNINPETKNMNDTYCNTTPSKSRNTSVISSCPEFRPTSMQLVKNYLNINDDSDKSGRSGGLITGTREEKVVNTAKLLDLPSPVFVRTIDEPIQCQEENQISSSNLKCTTFNEHEESIFPDTPKINEVLVHSESSDGTPGRTRRYSTSDIKVKAVIAERVKKCIQKALNDSRELFRSGSATDLRCSEPKPELVRHRRSYSFSCVQKLMTHNPDSGITQTSMMDVQNNSFWLKSNPLNTGFQNSRKSSNSRISRSFEDLYADIDSLDAKVSWGAPKSRKQKEFLFEKYVQETATTSRVLPECLAHSVVEDAVEMQTEADKSVFLDARTLSYVCEKAAEDHSQTDGSDPGSLNNIRPPWTNEHIDDDVSFDECDKAEQEQKECSGAVGRLRLKSDDSKVFSDSNTSLDSSSVLNPITHSTPVLRKDFLKTTALCSEPKISPLLSVVPVLDNSAVIVSQKLRPVRTVPQQEQKKGPLRAVVPVDNMTRNTKKREAVADQSAGKISQNVTTHKADSVALVLNDGKKPLRAENKSSPSSLKKSNKAAPSVNVKEDKKVQSVQQINSLANTPTLSSNKSIKKSTPLSEKGPKTHPRVDIGGRERTRSHDVKELVNPKPSRRPFQKSKSTTSVPLGQSTTPRALTEKSPFASVKDKRNSPANAIQKFASNITPKIHTIKKVGSRFERRTERGKENQTP